jgi:hypothetical protein
VPSTPAVIALLFAAALVVLAGLIAVRQIRARRRLADPNLPPDERAYLQGGGGRKIILCLNLLVTAGLLAGAFLSGMEARASALAQRPAEDGVRTVTEEERAFLRFYGGYWIAVVASVMTLMSVAAWDLWAVRRYGLVQLRRIQSDRRKMIRDELARHRRRQPPGPSANGDGPEGDH